MIHVSRGLNSGKVREIGINRVARANWDRFLCVKDGSESGGTITFRWRPFWHVHTFTFLNRVFTYEKKVFTKKGWKTVIYKETSFK